MDVFAEILKNLILGGFLGLFEPSEPIFFFFQKPGHINFLNSWCLTSWKLIRKSWWSAHFALKMDGKTNKAKFIGHFCEGGYPTSFCTMWTLETFSCSMVVHYCKTSGGIICIIRPERWNTNSFLSVSSLMLKFKIITKVTSNE